ncbi:MAG: hypothetical protein HZB65_01180 [Candidatus Aenigmarchaeota archaeon]|nr:hypothetical protein [Candidatus Aenigmarchaeota archaeon]
MPTENEIRFFIINKLWRHKVFGKHKINYDNLAKSNSRNAEQIYEVVEKLKKEGLLVIIPHVPKKCCYLNPNCIAFFRQKIEQGCW